MGSALSPRSSEGRRSWLPVVLGAMALLGLAAVVRGVLLAQRPPEGPQPVAWDRVACAHCRMLLSEPRFAAQAHTKGGAVLHFDDPGCALLWANEHPAELHELWFHDLASERWLRRNEVGFVPAEPSPMGYGLGATARSADGALPPAEAFALVMDRERERTEPKQ